MQTNANNDTFKNGLNKKGVENFKLSVLGFEINQVLMALKPDTTRGRSLKRVSACEKPITWLNLPSRRNTIGTLWKSHASMTESQVMPSTTVQTASGVEPGERRPIRGVISTLNGTTGQDGGGGGLHQYTVPGCSWSYKTPGWLARHLTH
jgi:hypothetical protein